MKVVILRGLPGAGKSTLAASLGGFVVSADNYFTENGEYKFDRMKIGEAHSDCKTLFVEALERKERFIVVDNTNTMKWEYEFYVARAKDARYKVEIVSVFDGGKTDEELAARNVHNCPLATIKMMRARWEK